MFCALINLGRRAVFLPKRVKRATSYRVPAAQWIVGKIQSNHILIVDSTRSIHEDMFA